MSASATGRYGTGRRASLVAVVATADDLDGARLSGLAPTADGLEIRADLVGDPEPRRLRRLFSGPLTYTLRSRRQGGSHDGTPVERRARLLRAAAQYDLVDLEWPDDLVPELTSRIPPRQRRISWHGPERATGGPHALFGAMAVVPAALYLLVFEGPAPAPGLLAALGRSDVTAFGTGEAGLWTRVLAPWLGAPVAFGRVGGTGADGMPPLRRLVADYGLPALPRLDALYGIAGPSSGRSLAPRLYNAALRELGLPALYLPFATDSLPRLLRSAAVLGRWTGLPLRGLTVTAPHKEDAVGLADRVAPSARGAGAANVLRQQDGRWYADTTDGAAVLHALAWAGVDPTGQRAAVVGCGGAGRAAALALHLAGASVTLVNRGRARGRQAAALTGLPFVPLAGFSARGYSLLVHATPLADRVPFRLAAAAPDTAVLDLVYRDGPTALAVSARSHGLPAIDGREVLIMEMREQFRLLTGRQMPLGPELCALGTRRRTEARPPGNR
ncbi:type I 3-dehydroquinate dehydratase [Kitasatospora sp. HPMI-4]|uniref:type I 3-dehydroquinate dehydratase n=1 Tax=Kitasatospora sp. HPMI-4 TaxID=3448443 RepID=UPI003F19A464